MAFRLVQPGTPTIVPRWYQQEANTAVWDYFRGGGTGNPLVAMPTGTGKSISIGLFVKEVSQDQPGTRVMLLTHKKELIKQNHGKLLELWPLAPAGIYSAGLKRREHSLPITYAGIGSVAKKAVLFGRIDIVIIDECHLLGPKDSTQYQSFLADLRRVNPNLVVIGFTATPYRLGQGHLTDGKGIFTDVCYNLTTQDSFARLIAEGHLAPLRPKNPKELLDVSNVGTVQGEFNQLELQAAVDKEAITRRAVEELIQHGEDRNHWLVFGAGVEHCCHIAEMLNEYGIPSIAVHSKMGDEARDQAILDWKAGRIVCAVNNDILTTGIDFPAIDLIGHLQPTKSTVRWLQGLGRGMRPFPGKNDCLVMDFAGNTKRLGTVDDPVLPKAKGKKGSQGAPVKLCPQCSTWNHCSVRFCVHCGEEFVQTVKIKETASTLKLMGGADEPEVLTFDVLKVEYDLHQPRDGRPPSLKVSYQCADTPLRFREFLAFESHSGLAKHKARDWWRKRCIDAPPETSEEAWRRNVELATPARVDVWVNTKYPEVMSHYFDE